jgi:glutathione S-transferase
MNLESYLKCQDKLYGIILFSYFRSSSSWRIRAILDYKGIPYNLVTVNLSTSEHLSE